jgi:hypothetical protein
MTQSNQKSSQQKCFFTHMGLCRTTGQNLGRNLFALLRSHSPALQRKLPMPCNRTGRPSFCPVLAEAVLLTGKIRRKVVVFAFVGVFTNKRQDS